MIISITVLLICSSILAVGWWFEISKTKTLSSQNESLQNDLTSAVSELVKANVQAQELQQKLESIAQQNDTPEGETGNYVRSRSFKPATPETYRLVFDFDTSGQRVLAHLQSKYLRDAYVDDRHGGERETCVRLGQRQVISYIINQINEANEPVNSKEIDNDN